MKPASGGVPAVLIAPPSHHGTHSIPPFSSILTLSIVRSNPPLSLSLSPPSFYPLLPSRYPSLLLPLKLHTFFIHLAVSSFCRLFFHPPLSLFPLLLHPSSTLLTDTLSYSFSPVSPSFSHSALHLTTPRNVQGQLPPRPTPAPTNKLNPPPPRSVSRLGQADSRGRGVELVF